jgi:hypothetical protein
MSPDSADYHIVNKELLHLDPKYAHAISPVLNADRTHHSSSQSCCSCRTSSSSLPPISMSTSGSCHPSAHHALPLSRSPCRLLHTCIGARRPRRVLLPPRVRQDIRIVRRAAARAASHGPTVQLRCLCTPRGRRDRGAQARHAPHGWRCGRCCAWNNVPCWRLHTRVRR